MNPTQKPILVTGATGYLASHCVKQLLEQGYKVRGTVRSLANKKKNQFLYELVPDKNENLELFEADLLKPDTWPASVEGCDYILHVASPFIIEVPKDENILIKPAVEGTLSVLKAALEKGAKKVVVTSSVAAVMAGNENKVCGPEDWSVEEKCGAYLKSKLKAERAAWKFWEDNNKPFELVTIQPGFIIGPLFTYADGASEKLIKEMLTGKMPAIPRISHGLVDVRNVAEVHIKALFSPNSNGKRYIASAETLWFKDMSQILRDEFGKYGYKVTKMNAPDCMVKFISWFDKQAKMAVPDLGIERKYNVELTKSEFGIDFIPARQSLKEMVDSMIKLGAVPNRLNKAN